MMGWTSLSAPKRPGNGLVHTRPAARSQSPDEALARRCSGVSGRSQVRWNVWATPWQRLSNAHTLFDTEGHDPGACSANAWQTPDQRLGHGLTAGWRHFPQEVSAPVLTLDRFWINRAVRRRTRAQPSHWSVRRRSPDRRLYHLRLVLPGLCGVGIAAAVGWMLAGGSVPSSEIWSGQPALLVDGARGAPIHMDSSPA